MSPRRVSTAVLLIAALAPAQMVWEARDVSVPRGAMCADSAGGKLVLVAVDGSVFTWDGASWQQRTAAGGPSQRNAFRIAFDSARGVVVLFGGVIGPWPLGDTWEWDGARWTQRHPPTVPGGRGSPAMCYDPVRGVVVMHGGWDGSAILGDTWEWDGVDWTERQPAAGPGPLVRHAMAFDATSGRALLFGGEQPGRQLSSALWAWDGVSWSRLASPTAPPARIDAGFACDSHRQRCVLFGGRSGAYGGSTVFDDSWEWDGTDWVRFDPLVHPPASYGHAMTYDPVRRRAVVRTAGPLWEWNGSAWNERPTPSPGYAPESSVSYDPIRQVVVLYRFDSERATWEWDGVAWRDRSPALQPFTGTLYAMAWHGGTGVHVLFGGSTGSGTGWPGGSAGHRRGRRRGAGTRWPTTPRGTAS